MRTFVEHKGVRLPLVERAGSYQGIRDAGEREQVLDACYTAHLGYELVKTGATSNYATPVRPEALSTDELHEAVRVMAAQVARIDQAKRDADDNAQRANADAKASAASQIAVVREALLALSESCPLFAVAIRTGLNKAEDQARAVASSRVLPQEKSAFHVPHSLAIALEYTQRELSKRMAAERADDLRFKALLERAGVSL